MINTDIRPPVISGSEAQQLQQIRSYLYQLSEQLNFALSSVQKEQETVNAVVRTAAGTGEKKATDDFEALKGLIIKSADIVNAYSDEISRKLESVYVSVSEYGTFSQTVTEKITENAENITQSIEKIEVISGDVDKLKVTQGYIKTGIIGTDPDIYGVEVGQTNEGTFSKFAQFTSDELSFWQGNDKVAYLSNQKLYITKAEITDSLIIGRYRLQADADSSVVIQWI